MRQLALPEGAGANPAQSPAPEALRAGQRPRRLVTLVIPAKNEELGLGGTLRSLPLATLALRGFDAQVIVLDGASHDRTREIARAWGAEVVEQVEPGKGSAVRSARHLLRGEHVIMLDADSTYAPDTIPRVLDLLERGEADVVMGSRLRGWVAAGAMGPLNRLGNILLSSLASVLYLRLCTDVCTGLWGFRRQAFRALPLRSRGFDLEVEMFGRAVRAGWRVREVPVDYLPRQGGTKLSRSVDGLRIGLCLLRTRFARGRDVPVRGTPRVHPAPHAPRNRETAPRLAEPALDPGLEPRLEPHLDRGEGHGEPPLPAHREAPRAASEMPLPEERQVRP